MKNNRIKELLNKAKEFRKEQDSKKSKEEIKEEIDDLLYKLKNENLKLIKLESKNSSRKKNVRRNFLNNRINSFEERLKELNYNIKISKKTKIKPNKKTSKKSDLKIDIKKNKNNLFLLKNKIRKNLAELKKLNQLIIQQQKSQKNNEAISTQAKIDKLKNKIKEYGEQYSNMPKIKKNFIPDHSEKANLTSSLTIMRESGLIYSPINAQAMRQTKGYKKSKKGKKKK